MSFLFLQNQVALFNIVFRFDEISGALIIIIIIPTNKLSINTFLYGAFTKLNAPYNDLQTENKIKIPI